ncbi:MAG: BatA domain-containing protein [Candidatus Kryptoniota bacterium]
MAESKRRKQKERTMTFLNPFILLGLAGAVVPFVIHLLQLRKLKPTEFSSVRFLKEIQQSSSHKIKLRNYLLLAIRTILIVALVLAFARPVVKGVSGLSRKAVVVIMDNTPSTAVRNKYGEIYDQGKSAATDVLNHLHVGDFVSLIYVSDGEDTSKVLQTSNPSSLYPSINRSEVSTVSKPYLLSLRAAAGALASSNFANKEVYLIGDMQKTEFSEARKVFAERNPKLFFIRIQNSEFDNLAVGSVKPVNPVVEAGSPVVIEAKIVNYSGSDRNVLVSLFSNDRKVAQSLISVPSRSSQNALLSFTPLHSGYHSSYVKIEDNSLQDDNTRYFSFYVGSKVNVLIISNKKEDNFLLAAVQAASDTASSRISLTQLTPDRLLPVNLNGFDVLLCDSYLQLPGFVSKLVSFAEEGGGVVLFAPQENSSGAFADLIAKLGLGNYRKEFSSTSSFLTLDKINAGSDFFAGIFSSIQSIEEIKRKLLIRIKKSAIITANPDDEILMETGEGPFLFGRNVGRGYSFCLTSSPDTSAASFISSPFFPIIVQRMIFYSSAVKHKGISINSGDACALQIGDSKIKNAYLVSRDGSQRNLTLLPGQNGVTFKIDRLSEPGNYALRSTDTLAMVSVNLDPVESDLTQASNDELMRFADKAGAAPENVFVLEAGNSLSSDLTKLLYGADLSSYFAAAALVLLLLEIFVARMRTFSGIKGENR